MADAKLTIWSNARLSPEAEALLRRGAGDHRLILSTAAKPHTDTTLADADIAFGQPVVDALLAAPRVKWVHITSAGYTRYDTDAFRTICQERGLILTNSSTVYAEPCAQHAAAFIYAHARQLPLAMRHQFTDRAWLSGEIREHSQLLGNQRMLIYGLGAIGRRLVELLAPLEMDIIAVRRSPTGNDPVKTITPLEAETLLGEADIIVNLLPANPSTDRFFSADRLAGIRPSAIFLNIGRGSTVDQDALLDVLDRNRLAAALLDVTTPEPLPPQHPPWQHPRCTITPHSAGGFAGEPQALVRHFLNNLDRFEHNAPLHDRVI